jgi:DNA-binding PadR family transcriptional regulator
VLYQVLQTEKPERLIYEYVCDKGSPVSIDELKEKLSKVSAELPMSRIRQAIMRLELHGLVTTYERKDNELIVALKERE